MPAASSRAPSRRTCRSCSRPSSSWLSMLKTARTLGLDSAADAARPRRRGDRMKRREFITLLGGAAAAWPLAARAQQPAMPVIGFLDPTSPDAIRGPSARISPGPEGDRLCRGRERRDRIPLGRESNRSAAGAGGRSGSPAGRRDRRDRRPPAAFAAKAATTTIPIVFIVAEDPVRLGLVASLARPGGNADGDQFFQRRVGGKAAGTPARAGAREPLVWPCSSIRPMLDCRDHVERRGSGCARHGAANPGPQRQHQPRDRCGLRNSCARAARRALRRRRPLLHQPACPIGPTGGAPRDPRDIFGRANLPKPAG